MRRLAVLLFIVAGGCQQQVMVAPNLYAGTGQHPFDDVPAELQTNTVEVIYVTDRAPVTVGEDTPSYGYGRATDVAFGTCTVHLGRGVSWEQLVAASRTKARPDPLMLQVDPPVEVVRSPDLLRQVSTRENMQLSKATQEWEQRVGARFKELVADRLARTDDKTVLVHVHGYKNSFNDAVPVVAQLWHFRGRGGVPLCYSWPAGRPGLLRGYTYDRESSEFTVHTLRRTLILLGEIEDLERVHIVAHSRGTDVAVRALREALLLHEANTERARASLKLGVVVLAAPDLDQEVFRQLIIADRLFAVPERLVVYVSERDDALSISRSLFLSKNRVGNMRPEDLDPKALERLELFSDKIQLIDADVTGYSNHGHDYYYRHPAVSSDLILLLSGELDPGPGTARPLASFKGAFWQIHNGYPTWPASQ